MEGRFAHLKHVPEDGLHQLRFVREVVQHRASGHAGLLNDASRARGGVSVLDEDTSGGLEDPAPGFLSAFTLPYHSGHNGTSTRACEQLTLRLPGYFRGRQNPTMGLFDVHAHLTDDRLAVDEAGVLQRARAAGVTTIIANGLNPADNAAVADLAARVPEVKPAFGLYPVDAVLPEMIEMGVEYDHHGREMVSSEAAIAWLEENLGDAIALGEVGLDHYWVPEALWALQEQVFRRLVRLAIDHNKPIIMHSRKAERRAFEVLKEEGVERIDWHCFGSKVKLARQIAEHGHWLSIPANAARVESFRKMIETLPRERILLETDCPYLSPDKGTINEPANVERTVALMAELWKVDEGAVVEQLESNFEALFGVRP